MTQMHINVHINTHTRMFLAEVAQRVFSFLLTTSQVTKKPETTHSVHYKGHFFIV